MNDVIQFISLITAICGIPFVPALWRWYTGYKQNQLTQSMQKVNEPLIEAYKQQLALIKDEIETVKKSQVADLHDKIYREGDKLLEQGHITVDQMDNFVHLFKAYAMLGGNGTGEAMYNRVIQLPITSTNGKSMYNRVIQLPITSTNGKSLVDEAKEIHERKENG